MQKKYDQLIGSGLTSTKLSQILWNAWVYVPPAAGKVLLDDTKLSGASPES
jgi:hypothetical protein